MSHLLERTDVVVRCTDTEQKAHSGQAHTVISHIPHNTRAGEAPPFSDKVPEGTLACGPEPIVGRTAHSERPIGTVLLCVDDLFVCGQIGSRNIWQT